MKKVLGVLVFLGGGFLGGISQTNVFADSPLWQTMLMLVAAFALCGLGVSLMRGKM